jgi:hypothetical protein
MAVYIVGDDIAQRASSFQSHISSHHHSEWRYSPLRALTLVQLCLFYLFLIWKIRKHCSKLSNRLMGGELSLL